jgi:hypothetical protein
MRSEKGQALVLVLILLLVGALIIAPLLAFMGTGLKAGHLHEVKMDELYAADAGIEDAQWQIKSDNIKTFAPPLFPVAYSPYNYTDNWTYRLSEQVNGKTVDVTINNVWTPTPENQYDESQAQNIINANKLVVTGSSDVATSTYSVKLTFSPGTSETVDNLMVMTLGIWLPAGFTYVAGSSNLKDAYNNPLYYSESVQTYHGNVAIIWSFASLPFKNLPNYQSQSVSATVTFRYTSSTLGQRPNAVAWIKTNGPYPNTQYAFDADVKVYKMTSVAGGTTVESYISKSELRKLQAAWDGDYYATGKALMLGFFPNQNHRDLLLTKNSSDVNSNNSKIPDNANVELAYLYWSGWVQDKANGIFWDYCGDLTSTDPNYCKFSTTGTWTIDTNRSTRTDNCYYERFRGQKNGSSLTMKSDLDLSGVPSGQASIHWDQAAVTTTPDIFSDTCTSNNLQNQWTNGGDWSYYSSSGSYRANHTSGSDTRRYLTHSQNLSSYSASTVALSWQWWTDSSVQASQGVDVYISSDNVNFTKIDGFLGAKTTVETRMYAIPSSYLTAKFAVRFSVVGSGSSYSYIDNILITQNVLCFQISNNGGLTWSAPYASLAGNRPPPTPPPAFPPTFDFTIPSSPINYYTSQFRIKFYLAGFNGSNEYAYIDNILITDDSITTHEDRNVTFTIQTNDGTSKTYSTHLTANPADAVHDKIWSDNVQSSKNGQPVLDGWYYACRKDVTDLVRQCSNGADLTQNPPIYGNGKGTYTVGDVYASNKSVMNPGYLGDSSYAGWSLLIVYSSPDTKGHQLYLYEDMTSVPYQQPNGSPTVITKPLSGFIVPQKITGETDAGRLTVFVGEGDLALVNDYVAFISQHDTIEHKLWDGVDCSATPWGNYGNSSGNPNNVWNGFSGDSDSPTTAGAMASESGIDVDTFHIKWANNWLQEGDTSAQIKLSTQGDGYVLVYMIISFRSKTTTGGVLGYLIKY